MFPTRVNLTPAPGVEGQRASTNPVETVNFGPGGLTSDGNCFAGSFAWIDFETGIATGVAPALPLTVPQGFVGNEQQGLITEFLGGHTFNIPQGLMVTVYRRGDFFKKNLFNNALYGQKVFTNKYGQITAGAHGDFVTTDVSNTASLSSARIDNGTAGTKGNVLTVTTGSGLETGQFLEDGAGNLVGYITDQASGTPGGAGVYHLNQDAAFPAGSSFGVGGESPTGFVGTASFATNVMTVVSTTSGQVSVGQFVQSTNVAAGTYVTADLGGGTWQLSTSPGTITTQAAETSGWIETPWSYVDDALAGDLAKIGILD